jgi:hypothetical protein
MATSIASRTPALAVRHERAAGALGITGGSAWIHPQSARLGSAGAARAAAEAKGKNWSMKECRECHQLTLVRAQMGGPRPGEAGEQYGK